MPNQELNESAAKATGAGNIFSERKGGIATHHVSEDALNRRQGAAVNAA